MKSIVETICKTILFSSILVWFGIVNVNAQEKNLETEIVVYFLPDSLDLPPNEKGLISLSRATIQSARLSNVLGLIPVLTISKTFPDWDNKDTVRVLENGKRIQVPRFSRVFTLTLPDKITADAAIELLSKEPSVLYAEPNMNAKLFSDPVYSSQWHLNNTGQSPNGTVDSDIDAPEAWQIFTGSSSVKIGIFDTGVDFSHSDFAGKLTGDNVPTFGTLLQRFHGTHVAGIAAAKANNGVAGRGVDWNAQIVSKRIFDGSQGYIGDNGVVSKIIDAIDNGNVDVLNHSWGGTQYSTMVRKAFAYAYKMNRVSVAGIGNDFTSGNPTQYPAAFGTGIIVVGATQNNDAKSPFSQTGNHIDVTAPGGFNSNPYDSKDILSAWNSGGTTYISGTSQAAPQVTGIASLLKGYNSNLYNDDIEQLISLGVDDKGSTGFDIEYGYGRVNAHKALLRLQSPYVLTHSTVIGGSIYATSGTFNMYLYDAPGLADNYYTVKRREIRKTINFSYMDEVHVWGRGAASIGWTKEESVGGTNRNFAIGHTEVVPGTVTNTSATLRTYIYEVKKYNYLGQLIGNYGWRPVTESNVQFAYTVHGIPGIPPVNASFTGPVIIETNTPSTWYSNASGGTPPYTYRWERQNSGSSSWTYLGSGSFMTLSYSTPQYFDLRLKVTDSTSEFDYFQRQIIVNEQSGGGCTDPTLPCKRIGESLPTEFSFSDNYPNPFNPSTQIKFELPERAEVSIKVYNIMGQEVATLINSQMQAGFHNTTFNADNLASGVYIARLSAIGSSGERFIREIKMQLIK